jgi:hypothetical protein
MSLQTAATCTKKKKTYLKQFHQNKKCLHEETYLLDMSSAIA